MNEPKHPVSVVIPCFNYGKYVNEALDSVLQQTLPDVEIILVDGGSDTSTIDTLKAINAENVTVYFRQGHHLVGSNRNYGIARSNAKYICCLDADDILDPTYLEKALGLLHHGNFDVVSTNVQCFGDTEKVWRVAPRPTLELLLLKNQVATVAVFKKNLWARIGGYRDFGIGKYHVAEDWDFWIRLAAQGATFGNIVDELLMKYRVHGESLSRQTGNLSYQEQLIKIKQANAHVIAEYFAQQLNQSDIS